MDQSIARNGKSYSRFWFIFTLLVGTFTMSISQSSLSTAYPTLMNAFGISASTVQWLTTGFMLVMCVSMPISPWMLNNMSFKTMFIGALGLFDIGSLMIVLTPASWGINGFWFMMIGRAMEAFAVGVLFPSYQTVLLEITPKEERGSTMGIAGLVMGSALACGHVVDQTGKKNPAWGINSGIFIVSLIAVIWFCIRQLHLKHPLLELRVLKTFNYDLAILLTSISYIALIVTTIIFPLYYQGVLKVSPFVSGMALVPGAAFLSILNPLSGKLADKIGFKPTMLVGMFMIIIGWVAGLIVLNHLSLLGMILCAMVIEGGNAFVMMPAVTLGANALPDELVPHGTAVITTVRQVLGSAGVTISTLILTVATSNALQRGSSAQVASLHGYHLVFIGMIITELIGLVLAFMLKNTNKEKSTK